MFNIIVKATFFSGCVDDPGEEWFEVIFDLFHCPWDKWPNIPCQFEAVEVENV